MTQPMDVLLTDEQRQLRETVREVAGRLQADPVTLEHARSNPGGADLISEVGLAGMRLPEALGGADASTVDVVIVAEELAGHAAVAPFLGHVLASDLLARCAGRGRADEVSETIGATTIALDRTLAAPVASRDEVLGWDGAQASSALAVVRAEQGLQVRLDPLSDREFPCADLTRVLRPAGGIGRAVADIEPDDLQAWQAFALTLVAADLVGVMAGALDLAIAYAKDRRQFGRPLGSFQAIQHMLADSWASLEASRAGVLHAAWSVDARPAPEALLAARVAKAFCSSAALQVTETVMQVHGGMGITWESLCHVFLRRAILDIATLGGEAAQLDEIANQRLAEGS
jgi:alkylation response protein AidB-like acyl-CoA dehydrogenase